ncbi:hypothetical protein [Pseudomonas sp. MIACH]|uniref:hypothetical protein n=1 Tax=Pseudomonas sp. MIACH TaxID=1078355 RepID=UPI00069CCAE3|nr:hypothetical protein [Pseudomonas sp. MIACH]
MLKLIEDFKDATTGLGPLYFPALFPANANTPGVDGSLGQRHSEHPQMVYINRPKNAYIGELLELYIDDKRLPVSYTFIREEDNPLALIPLLLPTTSIRPSWINPLECRINQTGESSLPLRLRVDLNPPAGADPNSDDAGHQGLKMQLPEDILIHGLSEIRAREDVIVTVRPYRHMAKNDRILLCWGDQQIYHWVKESEFGHPISIRVPYALIMQAHDSRQFRVIVQVRGHTGNFMTPRWSAATELDVYVHPTPLDPLPPLEPPILEGADPQTHVIDLEALAGGPVTCVVYATRDYFEVNDTLHLYCQGIDAQGRVLTHHEERRIEKVNQSLRIPLGYEYLRDMAQGLVSVYYVLEKHDDFGVIHSHASYATVQGDIPQWPQPHLNGPLINGHLSPDTTGLSVFVPFHKYWKPSDLISLVWLLPDPNGPVEYRFSRSAGDRPQNGLLEFELPAVESKRFEGRPSQLYYEASDLAGDQARLGESLRLTLTVGEPWARMLAPVVRNVVDHELDVSQASEGAVVLIHDTPENSIVMLNWVGPEASIAIPSNPTEPIGMPRRIVVPAHVVMDNVGKAVKLYWTSTPEGKPLRYSEVSTVWIVDKARP